MIGDGKEVPHEIIKARVLLEYSMDLNERVRVFHKRLVATLYVFYYYHYFIVINIWT